MALIQCVECKEKVSDKAATCPTCGAPVKISAKKKGSLANTAAGCLIIFIVSVVGITIAISLENAKTVWKIGLSGNDRTSQKTPPDIVTKSIPPHVIVDRDKYDSPVKTQVVVHAVISDKITTTGLKALLQKLYTDARATRGFEYHAGRPTHLFIYIYSSFDHYNSGRGQWIAMLSKVGKEARIETDIRTAQIAELSRQPEVKYGLPESKRKEIFKAVIAAEDHAHSKAKSVHPLPDPQNKNYSSDQVMTAVTKQTDTYKRIVKQYKTEIAQNYGISEKQIEAISMEGIKNNWPMP